MVKGKVPKRTRTIQAVINDHKEATKPSKGPRRTRTIQQLITDNTQITKDKLPTLRSQVKGKKEAKVAAPAPIAKKAIAKPKKATVAVAKATPKAATPKAAPAKKTPVAAEPKPVKGKATPKKEEKKAPIKKAEVEVTKAPRRTESKASAGIVDVVFCCDTTGSMGSYLDQTKQVVKAIVKNIKDKTAAEDISVRFGFVCYRDHPPQERTYVTKVQDLCTDDEVIAFIQKQDAQGGGDGPEAALDGLQDAAKSISWRDSRKVPSLRYIFHILDAPPHGKEFGSNSAWNDGVPSGVTLDKVVHLINIREIHYRMIKIGGSLEKLAELLKEKLTNYDETDLSHATDMNIRISDMIIRELLPDVDYAD